MYGSDDGGFYRREMDLDILPWGWWEADEPEEEEEESYEIGMEIERD